MFNLSLKEDSYSVAYTPSLLSKSMFYYFQGGGYFHCNPSYFTEREGFDSFLLLYTLGGKGILNYRNKKYQLEKGQVFIINCMEYQHYFTDSDNPWEFKYIHFNGSESKQYVDRILDNGHVVSYLKHDSIIPSHIDSIVNMAMRREDTIDIKASCLIVEMLTELLLISTNSLLTSPFPEYLRKVLNIIEHNYQGSLTLESLSRQVSIDKFYLTKQFKKFIGQSLYEYIINFRINKAKEFLKDTSLSINEIAEFVGFESPSHFIKTFKKSEAITPLRFRKFLV